jgi:hypothetical protein
MSDNVLKFPSSRDDACFCDYASSPVSRPSRLGSSARNSDENSQALKISDDWPACVAVTEAELDIFEVHFGQFLDKLLASKI